MMQHHYFQHVPSTPTSSIYSMPFTPTGSVYSMPSTPTGSVRSSIHSMPSTPTESERGDIHSGSLARGLWTEIEHEQFLEAMKMFPKGPWRSIAAFIGTRSIKQVQTHAQKYQQKIQRRQRGLRKQKKKLVRPEHRVDMHASGCIIRTKDSPSSQTVSSSLSPRSPSGHVHTHSRKSFTRMLADTSAMLDLLTDSTILDLFPFDDNSAQDDINLTMPLENLEPFPFTDVSHQKLCAVGSQYQQDMRESMDLLIA